MGRHLYWKRRIRSIFVVQVPTPSIRRPEELSVSLLVWGHWLAAVTFSVAACSHVPHNVSVSWHCDWGTSFCYMGCVFCPSQIWDHGYETGEMTVFYLLLRWPQCLIWSFAWSCRMFYGLGGNFERGTVDQWWLSFVGQKILCCLQMRCCWNTKTCTVLGVSVFALGSREMGMFSFLMQDLCVSAACGRDESENLCPVWLKLVEHSVAELLLILPHRAQHTNLWKTVIFICWVPSC